jgi:hypothetical protein
MPTRFRTAALCCVALAAVLVAGCARKLQQSFGLPNRPPAVQLTSTLVPAGDAETVAAHLRWSATDPDGRVDHYLVTEDLGALSHETEGWARTIDREQLIRLRRAAPTQASPAEKAASPFQLFAVRAADDDGAVSLPAYRVFFGDNIAPTVKIVQPRPSRLINPTVPPNFWVRWEGSDPDGLNGRPAKYKYKLYDVGSIPAKWISYPDTMVAALAPSFASWDSISGDSTQLWLTNLTVNKEYLFAITAIDAEGAYDPVFGLDKNMLRMFVVRVGSIGPRLTMFNDQFNYTYPSGGITTDPSWVVHIQVPGNEPLTVNWYADPTVLSRLAGYRWALDIADISDETARRNKNDLAHWSLWSSSTSVTLGLFHDTALVVPHRLYIEAQDENGLTSLGILEFRLLTRPSFDKDLLVVIDTRLAPDQVVSLSRPDTLKAPGGRWPSQAELDTFLFAVGGARWRMTPPGTLSPAGIFKGYRFDTLGTRRGLEDPSIPLEVLGRYRHIVWITDRASADFMITVSPTQPITALRYMSFRNRQNTLATWVRQGGKLWALGGGFGSATNLDWNNRSNDTALENVFTSTGFNPDLKPARFMYDLVHWQSEFRSAQATGVTVSRPPFPIGGWRGAPGYASLPDGLRFKSAATDPPWPFRGSMIDIYRRAELEYLSLPDTIVEDAQPSPHHQVLVPVLDTLMVATGSPLPLPGSQPAVSRQVNPVMTYYHGPDCGPVVFSGFNIWTWTRADCVQLVDAVLQGIWGLTRTADAGGVVSSRTVGRGVNRR